MNLVCITVQQIISIGGYITKTIVTHANEYFLIIVREYTMIQNTVNLPILKLTLTGDLLIKHTIY